MKKTLNVFSVVLIFSVLVFAQTSEVFARGGTKSIIEDINTRKVGQGNVRVMQDETIDASLAKYQEQTDTSGVIRLSDERVNGYKIQVFSGNNQHKSRSEAEYKQSLMRATFPEHQAALTYESPNWRVRVGNFLSRSEAEVVLSKMREAFPAFGKEMYLVNDVIRRPINR